MGSGSLADLLGDEVKDVRRAAHDALAGQAGLHGNLEHLAGHLEVGGDERVGVLVLDGLHNLGTKHVMDDAVPVGVHVEVVQEPLHRGPVVLGVKLRLDLLIGPVLNDLPEHGLDVVAHAGVGPVPQGEVGNLRRRLQHGLNDVGGGAGHRGHDVRRHGLGLEARVDVNDMQGVLVLGSLGQPGSVAELLGGLGETATYLPLVTPVHGYVPKAVLGHDGRNALAHEVDAKAGYGGRAILAHLHSRVAHHQRVADLDPLLVRQGLEDALQLDVHVEMRNDSHVGAVHGLGEFLYGLGIWVDERSLRGREGALGDELVSSVVPDEDTGERIRREDGLRGRLGFEHRQGRCKGPASV
mmetsp:Transcript_12981/g.25793  ORF Transcript_12981/g.25793 Transcript_12981/m.25793 type:complete len:354 (-) Transcript_12981:150-1211(-)